MYFLDVFLVKLAIRRPLRVHFFPVGFGSTVFFCFYLYDFYDFYDFTEKNYWQVVLLNQF